jgi:hypothetical protein
MSTLEPEHYHPDNRRLRITSYIVLGVIFLFLVAIALFTFRTAKDNQLAGQKADQLIAELTAQGIKPPDKDLITRTLGSDGGAICVDPANALKQGIERSSSANGAGGPGLRPVFIAKRMVEAELAAINIYCPEHAAEFTEYINSHTYADTIKE